jgi:Tfp pilus assembly pilus retraction ATPase PilT
MAIAQQPELDRAIQIAADRRATDAFLLPGEPLTLRINDQLQPTESPPYSPSTLHEIATAVLGPDRVAALSTTGHAFTSCHVPGVATAQLTAACANGQVAITLRMIPSFLPSAEDVALPQAVLDAAAGKSGLILFSGHVGSGKTTSAYTLLAHINATQPRLICTVEEPIAYAFPTRRPLILQREIGTDVPDTVTGIVASLRQDADVIFVGELRSLEEVNAGVTAAGLNRLVITQTHARTALRALHRLIDLQPPDRRDAFRRQLADTLAASVAQTLLPTAHAEPGRPRRVPAYDVLIPDADFRRSLAEGRNPLSRGGPLPRSQFIVEEIRSLAARQVISAETAAAALAEYAPLADASFWA